MSVDRKPSTPRRFPIPRGAEVGLATTIIALAGMNGTVNPPNQSLFYSLNPELATHILRQREQTLTPEVVLESQADKHQPRKPYYLFIAYPWSQNQRIDGKWRYWNDNGGRPPQTWINNIMPMFDQNGSTNPEDNLYSGNDPRTWEWYMRLGMRAHVGIFAFTNWGPGTRTAETTKRIFEWMASPQNPNPLARATAYGEIISDPNRTPEVDEFVEYIEDYKSYALNSPVAWRDPDDWKLIVPFYTRDEHDTLALKRLAEAARTTDIHAPVRPFSFFNEKIFLQGLDPQDEPYGLIPYAPANADVEVERNGMTGRMISAGFDPSFPKDPRVLRRDPERTEALLFDQALNPADYNVFVLEETGEATGWAPYYYGIEFTSTGPVVDPQKNWGFTYIDLLGKYLPPLPVLVPDQPGSGAEYAAATTRSGETIIISFPNAQ